MRQLTSGASVLGVVVGDLAVNVQIWINRPCAKLAFGYQDDRKVRGSQLLVEGATACGHLSWHLLGIPGFAPCSPQIEAPWIAMHLTA